VIALGINTANLQGYTNSYMQKKRRNKFILFCCFLLSLQGLYAQVQTTPVADTSSRLIQIVGAKSFRQKTIDSVTTLTTLAGNAVVRQGNTILSGDSIVLNQQTGIAEVFGNVHINDADSVHTYAQYLKYIGNEKMAYLKRNVRLTDGKAVLTTDDLEYNLQTGIAKYTKGGRVVNGTTVLTSDNAVYYSDTKDVFFKNRVHLVDAKSDMVADSLRYNTQFREAYFISPTRINTKDGIINTSSGTYNVETGDAIFFDRTSFSDSSYFMSGDRIASDAKTGVIQIEGHGKLVDSTNSIIVLGDQILLDRKKNSFLATRKPVMILFKNNDSTYVAADTLFSGMRKFDTLQRRNLGSGDSLKKTMANDQVFAGTDTVQQGRDIKIEFVPDSSAAVQNDTLARTTSINLNKNNPDSIRYFIAFHHVRIFNDSLQAVSDSLHYSTEDSTFKLYYDPVFWNDKTQVSGDTMLLFTENQKAKRLYVFNAGLVVNRTTEGFFNQAGGRTLNGYFKDGSIDYVRVKGTPAESIYYPQDEDSAYVGMNRSSGDVIDVYFKNKELYKIKFINDVNGTMYPLKQVPEDMRFLKGFKWMDARRPKNKLELFE
jgi:lipopolysaccharide export system protein LptA